MPNRESLHELIDALPESCARIDRASSLYRTIKLGRQSRPLTWRRCANGSTNFLESAAKNWADRTGTGFVSALIGGSRFKPDGDGMASMSTSEGETLVTLEIHVFRGHRLEIEERLRLSEDKKSLVYTQQTKGPKGKEARYEIEFEVA